VKKNGSNFLRSALSFSPSGFCLVFSFCLYLSGIFISPALSEFYPEDVFGTPEQFYEEFKKDTEEKLNQYLGAALAVSGFILIARSFTRG